MQLEGAEDAFADGGPRAGPRPGPRRTGIPHHARRRRGVALYDITAEIGQISEEVAPIAGEPVVVKQHFPSSFFQTDLAPSSKRRPARPGAHRVHDAHVRQLHRAGRLQPRLPADGRGQHDRHPRPARCPAARPCPRPDCRPPPWPGSPTCSPWWPGRPTISPVTAPQVLPRRRGGGRREQGGEQAPAPVATEGAARGSREPLLSLPLLRGSGTSESLTTVLVAFGANILVAVAKSAAAVVIGWRALVAEQRRIRWADYRQQDVPADRQPAGTPPAEPRSPVRSWPGSVRVVAVAALGSRRQRSHYRSRTASPNSSIRNRPNTSSSGMSYWPCPLSWREFGGSCSRSGRPDPRPSRSSGI